MTDSRILLDAAAFLDARPQLVRSGVPQRDARIIAQRFLTVCYSELQKAPHELDGHELEQALCEYLPRHFEKRDALAETAEPVIAELLEYLGEAHVVQHAFEQRMAFERVRGTLSTLLARGARQATSGSGQTVVHRADKTGRNDPCPCGSGKKFKKCCAKL